MLRSVIVIHSVVYVDLLELIVIGEWATCYIDSHLGLPIRSEYQELTGVVQMPGNLETKSIRNLTCLRNRSTIFGQKTSETAVSIEAFLFFFLSLSLIRCFVLFSQFYFRIFNQEFEIKFRCMTMTNFIICVLFYFILFYFIAVFIRYD